MARLDEVAGSEDGQPTEQRERDGRDIDRLGNQENDEEQRRREQDAQRVADEAGRECRRSCALAAASSNAFFRLVHAGLGRSGPEGRPQDGVHPGAPGVRPAYAAFTCHRVTSYERTGVRLVLCNNAHTHDLSPGGHQSATLCEQSLPRGR
jgi:hypothetical protein